MSAPGLNSSYKSYHHSAIPPPTHKQKNQVVIGLKGAANPQDASQAKNVSHLGAELISLPYKDGDVKSGGHDVVDLTHENQQILSNSTKPPSKNIGKKIQGSLVPVKNAALRRFSSLKSLISRGLSAPVKPATPKEALKTLIGVLEGGDGSAFKQEGLFRVGGAKDKVEEIKKSWNKKGVPQKLGCHVSACCHQSH